MAADEPAAGYDVFISYSRQNQDWVETLRQQLVALGLRCFVDKKELSPGESFPRALSDALERSRYLALIVTPHSAASLWVAQEWEAFLATHGPRGRIIPIMLESATLPAVLRTARQLDALHRDAARVATELASVVSKPDTLQRGDSRRLYLGQDLVFALEWNGDMLNVTDPAGNTRTVVPPWRESNEFGVALLSFNHLSRTAVEEKDRPELFQAANTLGRLLFEVLFDASGVDRLERAMIPGQTRPLVTILSSDDVLLSLPWELISHNDELLARDGRVDIVRSTPDSVGSYAILPPPSSHFSLVVNVSAPEGSALAYEEESYRITRALSEDCRFVPTELGTVEDLVATVAKERPTGVHFSGHGLPGGLLFEDDEGQGRQVSISAMLRDLRVHLSDETSPKFFYLASCHGNDPSAPEEGKAGAQSAAAQLHREGITQVAGYYGPISDALSTRAEAALYVAIANGETTRYAVRLAREGLIKAPPVPEGGYRPSERDTSDTTRTASAEATADAVHTHPFAWAQLVLYHRGPDQPLSLPRSEAVGASGDQALQRTFEGIGNRRVLKTGFIGRRLELHRLRKRIRAGDRIFVLQGLGGLGKSTLALHLLPMLVARENVCTIWCQEAEKHDDVAAAVVQQLLEYCRQRFGLDWEQVVQQVDRAGGEAAPTRFAYFLQIMLENVEELALYFDNLESLQFGPAGESAAAAAQAAFAEWRSDELAEMWRTASRAATDSGKLRVVVSTRYTNTDLKTGLLPVSPLPRDALFRLMAWFPALRRLTVANRARLAERLAGHPRAVEFANDLVQQTLTDREDRHGEWRLPQPPTAEDIAREWAILVEPLLPEVRDKLSADLLLDAIWQRVLGDRERRMLWRMTLLRRPWEWDLVKCLGESDEPDSNAEATGKRLRQTSLLEQMDVTVRSTGGTIRTIRDYAIHPATAELVSSLLPADTAVRVGAHRRIGDALAIKAVASPYINDDLEAGYHLLEAGQCDRSYKLLGAAAEWLQQRGRVREALQILTPFLIPTVQAEIARDAVGRLLGTIGVCYSSLGQAEKAIGFFDQALVVHLDIGDRRGEGSSLGNLGLAYANLGQVEKAISFYERHITIAREIGDRRGEGSALNNLGNAYFQLGKVEKAIGFYEERITIARKGGDRRGEGSSLGNLGLAYANLRQVEKAISFYEQHIAIAHEIGDRRGEGNALNNLGNAYRVVGQVEKAIGYYEQSLVIAREIGDRGGEGNSICSLGIAYDQLGQVENAATFLQQALRIGQEIKNSQIIRVATAALEELHRASETRP